MTRTDLTGAETPAASTGGTKTGGFRTPKSNAARTAPRAPRIVLVGGAGARSGLSVHLEDLTQALAGEAALTVLHDCDRGGYGFVTARGHRAITVAGLASSLNPLRLGRAGRRLHRALAHTEADLVWAHERPAVLLTRILRALGRLPLPLAVTFHGIPFAPGHRGALRGASWAVEWALLRATRGTDLIFLTEAERARYCRAFPRSIQRHRTHVLGNSTAMAPSPPRTPARDTRVVLVAGRDAPQKDLPAAARILAHLPPRYRLVYCGAGTDAPGFRARIAAQVDPRRVTFAGPQPHMGPWLAQADLVLLTSRYEGLSIAALEGFRAGRLLAMPRGDGADEILAHHPLATAIDPTHAPQAAARIDALMARADGPEGNGGSARITAAWADSYAIEGWQERARALAATLGPHAGAGNGGRQRRGQRGDRPGAIQGVASMARTIAPQAPAPD